MVKSGWSAVSAVRCHQYHTGHTFGSISENMKAHDIKSPWHLYSPNAELSTGPYVSRPSRALHMDFGEATISWNHPYIYCLIPSGGRCIICGSAIVAAMCSAHDWMGFRDVKVSYLVLDCCLCRQICRSEGVRRLTMPSKPNARRTARIDMVVLHLSWMLSLVRAVVAVPPCVPVRHPWWLSAATR